MKQAKKILFKLISLLGISFSCTSCDKCLGLLLKNQPTHYGTYYIFDIGYVMVKTSLEDLDNSIINTDQTICLIANQNRPSIIYVNQDIEISSFEVACFNFMTFDESYLYDRQWTSEYVCKSVYLSKEKIVSFLKQYDYFYFYARYVPQILIKVNGEVTYFKNCFEIKTKFYGLFPFKDSQLKLDELQDFYIAESVQPYMYEQITKYDGPYGGSIVPFTNYYWNNMTPEEFESSFTQMANNPPLPCFERDWGW